MSGPATKAITEKEQKGQERKDKVGAMWTQGEERRMLKKEEGRRKRSGRYNLPAASHLRNNTFSLDSSNICKSVLKG